MSIYFIIGIHRVEYELKSTRHAKYLLHAHIVFTPKYRKKIFTKEHLNLMEEVFNDICKMNDSSLEEFDGESDHVHLLIECTPQHYIPDIIKALKGISARLLMKEYESIFKKKLWGGHLWNPSYFIATVSENTEEQIRNYIKSQKEK